MAGNGRPGAEKLSSRADFRTAMENNAIILWFTGMSGAGKSTLAHAVAAILEEERYKVLILDGDHIRNTRHKNLGFSKQDILENNRLIAELCVQKRADFHLILVPIISPYASGRSQARELIGNGFYEIYIKASLEELVHRDPKGLYRKSIEGELSNLIGVSPDNPYETPDAPDLTLCTDRETLQNCVTRLADHIREWMNKPRICRKGN